MNQASNQSGFALITVLIVQLMIGVIAYAAIDTAILGQAQTHASSESHLAYNGAEQILVEGMRCIQGAHKTGKSIDTCKTFNNDTQNGLTIEDKDPGPGVVLTASRGEDSGARRTVTLTATPPLSNTLFDANGAYTCLGSGCEVKLQATGASLAVDGTNHLLPGQNAAGDTPDLTDGCGTQGQNRLSTNPDGGNKAGLIVPGPGGVIDVKGGKTAFAGSPDSIESPSEYNENYGEAGDSDLATMEQAKADLNGRIDALASTAETSEGDISIGDGDAGIWVVGEGQTISLDGKAAGGTIILDGGTLNLRGNACFAGMVASRNGKIDIGGTSAIVGAALQLAEATADGIQEGILDMSGGGNSSVIYSSSALEWAREVSSSTNSGDRWRFDNYQQVTN